MHEQKGIRGNQTVGNEFQEEPSSTKQKVKRGEMQKRGLTGKIRQGRFKARSEPFMKMQKRNGQPVIENLVFDRWYRTAPQRSQFRRKKSTCKAKDDAMSGFFRIRVQYHGVVTDSFFRCRYRPDRKSVV
jgi:hypothetical protein